MSRDKKLNRNPPYLDAIAVRYDKGEYVCCLEDQAEIHRLRWSQKPVFFADENEYRLHFQYCYTDEIHDEQGAYTIELGNSLIDCEIIERQ